MDTYCGCLGRPRHWPRERRVRQRVAGTSAPSLERRVCPTGIHSKVPAACSLPLHCLCFFMPYASEWARASVWQTGRSANPVEIHWEATSAHSFRVLKSI